MALSVKRIFGGDQQGKKLKKLTKRVDGINAVADKYKGKSIEELKDALTAFREQVSKEEKTLDELLPDVFALVREASELVLGMRHFDVQLIGGMVLHDGDVAEMRTGEGKTLVATLPVVLNAIGGKGVHLVTVNDYLASRDAGWMGQLYSALGLTVGVIVSNNESLIYDPEHKSEEHEDPRMQPLRPCSRREAYHADVTYGTNNEFGFDYLRDNMISDNSQRRQRGLSYAIVDEVDSILIDEARTPLIISDQAASSASLYSKFSNVVKKLTPDDYELDEKRRMVALHDEAIIKVQKMLEVDNLYSPENVNLIYHLDQALRADTLFKKDKDYVVSEDGEVIIVDEFTGRLMHGRRYNEGIHQAIEAKEGVEVQKESMTLATISFQNLFRLYGKLSGMTGTAETEAEEFYEIYELDVLIIPTNKPIQREDRPDRIYKDVKSKFNAIAKEVKELNEQGRPVLIGTASIEKNEELSRLLAKEGVGHQVLNAKNNEGEASIVSKAGQKGAVTIATNIAGRGTDIVLGEGVKELGGLVVVGSERHESRRIDNQLRGRCGRQGDPGMTQFYVSAEDDLMRIFGGDRIAGLMERLGVDDETPIEQKSVSKALEGAQKKVEGHNFDSRKQVVQYDDVMNRHRRSTYTSRNTILEQEGVEEEIKELVRQEAGAYALNEGDDVKEIVKDLQYTFPLSDAQASELEVATADNFTDKLSEFALEAYEKKEEELTPEQMRFLERRVYLSVLDNLWMQHLEGMQHLREGIKWQSMAQRDPLVEYRRGGQRLFDGMQSNLSNEVVKTIFRLQPVEQVARQAVIETDLTKAAVHSQGSMEADVVAKPSASNKPAKVLTRETTEVKALTEEDKKIINQKKRQDKKKKKNKRKKGRK